MRQTFWVVVHLACLWAAGCRGVGQEGRGTGALPADYLVVAVPGEPLTWNRLVATDATSIVITERIHAALVRVNRRTQEVEPELAESWSFSEDGKTLTIRLRSGVRFSDGTPLTAADVAFTFRALHDPDVGSPLAAAAQVGGEPLRPEVVDPLTVRFHMPYRTAVVPRVLETISILPRHRLEAALDEGNFVSAVGVGADIESLVGLGPFVVERYLPGQRVVLRANPHYWKQGTGGEKLPRLVGIIFEIVPDGNARMLRLLAGELDLVGEGLGALQPEDFLGLGEKRCPYLRLIDLGPSMTPVRLWFNLNPDSPTVPAEKRAWFSSAAFRRAISLAIDRAAIVDAVYQGLATPAVGPVSPANRQWRNETIAPPVLDRQQARRLLDEAGFRRDKGGALRGPEGLPVRFALITNSDNRHRSRIAALVQEDLAELGIEMRLATLDLSSLVARITRSFDYEACLLGLTQDDPDPAAEMPMWLSRAPLHFWHPSQSEPQTAWEARIDFLMEQQMVTLDRPARKALFDEVQAILVEELPIISLVVPHALVGVNTRVENLKATPFWHPTLWNAEEISLNSGS